MIEYIDLHQPGFWMTLGFSLLALEVLLFGFATIILFFAGLAALSTGLAMELGLLPATWTAGVASFGVSTGLLSLLLWKPLLKLQGGRSPRVKPASDLVGHEFVLQQAISRVAPGKYRYSGVDWQVELAVDADDQLAAGQRVVVTSVDAGIFRVKASA